MFQFVFSVFGLLLGLSLAEVLRGYARAMRNRANVPVGLLTPMLGLVVMLDLISFWSIAWLAHEKIVVANLNLFVGFAITGVYYLAATSIFPTEETDRTDFDSHYFKVKRKVVGAILACNLATYLALGALFGRPPNSQTLAVVGVFIALYAVTFIAKTRRANIVLLSLLLAAYVGEAILFYPSIPPDAAPGAKSSPQTTPNASIASATFLKPAMLAPFT